MLQRSNIERVRLPDSRMISPSDAPAHRMSRAAVRRRPWKIRDTSPVRRQAAVHDVRKSPIRRTGLALNAAFGWWWADPSAFSLPGLLPEPLEAVRDLRASVTLVGESGDEQRERLRVTGDP